VRAALSMQRAVRRVLDDERGGGAPLGLRVGLNTGPVLAGVQAGLEYTVIGDTVNTAARLADAAAVGAIYAGEPHGPRDRSGGQLAIAAPVAAQGKARAGRDLRVARSARCPRHPRGAGRGGPVRRARAELGRVAGRWPRWSTATSRASLVFTAEAGIGKTRFASEVARFRQWL
jgi:class 3 adenylate cyclase